MTKSFVGMGCYECPVCLEKHTEVVLVHKKLKDTFNSSERVIVDNVLCDVHKRQQADGYVFLVEVNDATKLCTGRILSVNKDLFGAMFNQDPPSNKYSLGFITEEAREKLEKSYCGNTFNE